MGLSADDIAEIDALLGSPETEVQAVVTEVRQRFPRLSITRCDASDMSAETPFREYAQFDLYLVDGGGHCWRITASPGEATGLVIASRARARSV